MKPRTKTLIRVPVSVGELVDRVSILSIKAGKTHRPDDRNDVRQELNSLLEVAKRERIDLNDKDIRVLWKINRRLWTLEDAIRNRESKAQWDREFIRLARAICRFNDKRAMLKRSISLKYHSALVERKVYAEP